MTNDRLIDVIRRANPVTRGPALSVDAAWGDIVERLVHRRSLYAPPQRRMNIETQLLRRPLISILAVAAIIIAAVVVPITLSQSHVNGPKATIGQVKSTWNLAGYLTGPGWLANSASGPLPTTQTDTLQLVCPSTTMCYSTGVNNSGNQTEGVISVTSDGGASWTQSFGSDDGTYFSGITCPTTTTCMAIGIVPNASTHPSLYTTTDAGEHWSVLVMPGTRVAPVNISCPTVTKCVVVGQEETSPSPTAFSYVTNDGGKTWDTSALPSDFWISGSSQSSLDCFADGHCVVIGSEKSTPPATSQSAIFYSANFGATWTGSSAPTLTGSLVNLGCSDTSNCIAIDDSGKWNTVDGELVTSDGGVTWTSVSSTGLNSPNPQKPLVINSLSCPTLKTCWASGTVYESTCQGTCQYVPVQAAMLTTSDRGLTWTEEALPSSPSDSLQYVGDYPVDCLSDTACFAIGTLELTQAANTAGDPWVQQDVVLSLSGSGTLSTSGTSST
jgi:photosystem II stability/assembly factor-like uncharacterized protein